MDTDKRPEDGKIKRLEVTGVFIEIGLMPNSEPVKDLLPLTFCSVVLTTIIFWTFFPT